MFDPPLRRWERRLLWLWTMVTGCAVAGMALGIFWWIAVLLITIPMVVAAYVAPTLWLYFTPGLLAWLALRSRPALGFALVVGTMLLVGLGVPALMNAYLKAEVKAFVAQDGGPPVAPGQGGTVAWLDDIDGNYCSNDCLRFFITRKAQAVLIGPSLSGPPEAGRMYRRLALVPWSQDKGCPMPPDVEKIVDVKDLRLIDPDLCVRFDKASLGEARLIFNNERHFRPDRDFRVPPLQPKLERFEVYGWQAGQARRLFRRSHAEAPQVAVPLNVWPMQGADTIDPARWDRTDKYYSAGKQVPIDVRTLLADPMTVPEFDDPA